MRITCVDVRLGKLDSDIHSLGETEAFQVEWVKRTLKWPKHFSNRNNGRAPACGPGSWRGS